MDWWGWFGRSRKELDQSIPIRYLNELMMELDGFAAVCPVGHPVRVHLQKAANEILSAVTEYRRVVG